MQNVDNTVISMWGWRVCQELHTWPYRQRLIRQEYQDAFRLAGMPAHCCNRHHPCSICQTHCRCTEYGKDTQTTKINDLEFEINQFYIHRNKAKHPSQPQIKQLDEVINLSGKREKRVLIGFKIGYHRHIQHSGVIKTFISGHLFFPLFGLMMEENGERKSRQFRRRCKFLSFIFHVNIFH